MLISCLIKMIGWIFMHFFIVGYLRSSTNAAKSRDFRFWLFSCKSELVLRGKFPLNWLNHALITLGSTTSLRVCLVNDNWRGNRVDLLWHLFEARNNYPEDFWLPIWNLVLWKVGYIYLFKHLNWFYVLCGG